MKKNSFIICFLFTCSVSVSQTPADKWVFGLNAGVDFTFAAPVAFTYSALNTIEGCASIADNAGNLLFYTDGISVWNSNNQVMPNGTGLTGGSSSTQAALIVPLPGSTTLFYLFTTDETGGPNGFRYSVVDMSLQSGLGDVTAQKNILVLNNVTEKLTAVKESIGINYKIAVHEWGTNAFHVYTLTSSGLQLTPVISNVGIIHTTTQIQNTYGQMKFSPCGDRVALAAGYLNTVEVFDFDDVTGIISNAITLPMTDHVYGLEFSPDGRFLYVTTYDVTGTLVQFDLSSGNAAVILASKTVLSTTPDTYALQLAPDGKIYSCKSWSYYLGVINDPVVAGTGCNYVDNGFLLDPNFGANMSALGLPAFVQSFFRDENACVTTGSEEFTTAPNSSLYPNPSSGSFIINFSDNHTPTGIFISDATGRIVQSAKITTGNFYFGESFSPGVYFVFLKSLLKSEVLMAVKSGSN